jgi:multisubunit Na+/H+ antiporter MnhB subunit
MGRTSATSTPWKSTAERLSLDDYNRRIARDAIGFKFLYSTMFLCTIGVWVWMFSHRHTPVPKLPEPRTLRFRDFVPVGIVLGVLASGLLGINGWYGEGWAGEWAGPGMGGLLLGIAGGFALGMCLAAVMGAMPGAIVWVRKSKRRSAALNVAILIVCGVMLAFAWKVYLRFVVVCLIAWAVITVLRRAGSAEQALSSSE